MKNEREGVSDARLRAIGRCDFLAGTGLGVTALAIGASCVSSGQPKDRCAYFPYPAARTLVWIRFMTVADAEPAVIAPSKKYP
jgi:hypothetical protein